MKIKATSMDGIFTLDLKKYDFIINRIIIFDMFGNQITSIEKPNNQQEINLSTQPNGIYHISAIFDDKQPPIRLKIFK